MITALVLASIALYFIMGLITAWYVAKVGYERNWVKNDKEWAIFLGFLFWVVAWMVMVSWWISTKMKVPSK